MAKGILTAKDGQPDATSVAYDAMVPKWELIDDLMGGTQKMRDRGEKWLPKEPKEADPQYRTRLDRSFLFNGLRDTVEKLVAKPFSREVNVEGDDDERLSGIADDADRMGTNITSFASSLLTSAIKYGLVHVLVDFPQVPEGATLATERKDGLRPYFVQVDAPRLLGWKAEFLNSRMVLTEARIHETRIETPDGSFADETVDYVRVYGIKGWELYKFDKNEKVLVKVDEGPHSFEGVPLVTIYIDQKAGLMAADPPLEDLAWLNIAHWQSQSDQRNILRFARIGILFGKGMEEEEMKTFTIGPTKFFKTTSAEADLKYVEHTGKAIESGRQDLIDLEVKMELLGLQPMIASRSGTQTATGKAIDEGRTESAIQSWIRRLENGLVQCYEFAAQWVNGALPDDFSVDIFNDFGITLRGTTDQQTLKELATEGFITTETLLRELKRRGTLSDALDVTKEAELAETESINRMSKMVDATDDDDDDDVDDLDVA